MLDRRTVELNQWSQIVKENPNAEKWLYVAVSDALNASQQNYRGSSDDPFNNQIVFTFGRNGLNVVDWYEVQSINEINTENNEIVIGWLKLSDWITPGQNHEILEDWIYRAIESIKTAW
jgi:hypothetical protein